MTVYFHFQYLLIEYELADFSQTFTILSANNKDPDLTPRSVASDLDLCCLQKIGGLGSRFVRVKLYKYLMRLKVKYNLSLNASIGMHIV